MSKKIIFITIVAAIIGVIVWYSFIRIDKKKAITIIVNANPARVSDSMASMDEDYLISWAKAIKAKNAEFYHNGKTYVTATGKGK